MNSPLKLPLLAGPEIASPAPRCSGPFGMEQKDTTMKKASARPATPAPAPVRDQLLRTLRHLQLTRHGLLDGAERLLDSARARAGLDIDLAVADARMAHFYLKMFSDLEFFSVRELDLGAPPFEPLASANSNDSDATDAVIASQPWLQISAVEVQRLWTNYAALVAMLAKRIECPRLPTIPSDYA